MTEKLDYNAPFEVTHTYMDGNKVVRTGRVLLNWKDVTEVSDYLYPEDTDWANHPVPLAIIKTPFAVYFVLDSYEEVAYHWTKYFKQQNSIFNFSKN